MSRDPLEITDGLEGRGLLEVLEDVNAEDRVAVVLREWQRFGRAEGEEIIDRVRGAAAHGSELGVDRGEELRLVVLRIAVSEVIELDDAGRGRFGTCS